MTKSQKEKIEATENMREALAACGPGGKSTLLITVEESRPSSSGRTEYLSVRVMGTDDAGRPSCTYWLTMLVSRACGLRFNKPREAISMGGYGYSRPAEIAGRLAKLCGHPLYVQTLNAFAGPNGWYPKRPEVTATREVVS